MATNETASGQSRHEIESTIMLAASRCFDFRVPESMALNAWVSVPPIAHGDSSYLRRSGTPDAGNNVIHSATRTGLRSAVKLICPRRRSCLRWLRRGCDRMDERAVRMIAAKMWWSEWRATEARTSMEAFEKSKTCLRTFSRMHSEVLKPDFPELSRSS